jgi:hypothetical protein
MCVRFRLDGCRARTTSAGSSQIVKGSINPTSLSLLVDKDTENDKISKGSINPTSLSLLVDKDTENDKISNCNQNLVVWSYVNQRILNKGYLHYKLLHHVHCTCTHACMHMYA